MPRLKCEMSIVTLTELTYDLTRGHGLLPLKPRNSDAMRSLTWLTRELQFGNCVGGTKVCVSCVIALINRSCKTSHRGRLSGANFAKNLHFERPTFGRKNQINRK